MQPKETVVKRIAFKILEKSTEKGEEKITKEEIEGIVNTDLQSVFDRVDYSLYDHKAYARRELKKCLTKRYDTMAVHLQDKSNEAPLIKVINECTSEVFEVIDDTIKASDKRKAELRKGSGHSSKSNARPFSYRR